jgi:hypothetical protein
MKPRSTTPDIDALYGLEPVIDVEGGEQTSFTTVQCPYCGEPFETTIDTSAGSTAYIEDCQVCCRPIEMNLEVDVDGAMTSLTATRTD